MAETLACTRCGTDNPINAQFCVTCGASLSLAATGQTRPLVGTICPSCGTQNVVNAQFCGGCGQRLAAKLETYSQPYAGTPQQGGQAMYCPVCREVTLVIADRQGIEIDYCPNCRGVWLDRGELDKIIERVAVSQGETRNYPSQRPDHGYKDHREHRDHDDDYRRKKGRRGILDELFDFD